MAFALTAWKGYPRPIDQGTIKRWEHVVEFKITGLVGDVDLDIGDLAGNFWTAAIADATYGDYATAAVAYLGSLYPKLSSVTYASPELGGAYVKVLAGPALPGEYAVILNATTGMPEIAFTAGAAPTALTLRFECALKTSEWPLVDSKYGTSI
jgi:hypothetical protein